MTAGSDEGARMSMTRLAQARVVDRQGRRLGRVRDVYLADRTGEVAGVTVALGRMGLREVLVPATLLGEAEPGRVRVDADAATLQRGRPAPATGYAGPDVFEAAAAALGGPS